jgi:hypothetical protein
MIRVVDVRYTDEPPMRPADADFGVTIDFTRGESDPVRVFGAMTDLLSSFSEIDRVLIGAIEPDAEPITVIEDVEAESLTAWLRNKLGKIDDQALKEFDLKKQIGSYAVKAKYRIIRYLDERVKKEEQQRLSQLRSDLEALAAPLAGQLVPPHVDMKALLPPMNEIQRAKSRLTQGEKVTIKSDKEPEYQLDLSAAAPITDEEAKEQPEQETSGDMELILLIKKADLIGNSQWEFRQGKMPVHANIEDRGWLGRFHRGEERIVPGASVRAIVHYERKYDAHGQIIESEYDVTKVLAIIPPTPQQQQELFA